MKILVVLAIALSLSGCHTLRSIASGGSERTYAGENKFGFARYSTKTTSKSAEVMSAAAEAIKNLPRTVEVKSLACGGITFDQIAALAPSAQSAAMNCLTAAQANRPMEIMGQALAGALGGNKSDAQVIFEQAANAISSIQSAALGKWNAATNLGFKFKVAHELGSAVKNGQNAQRDQSIAASENAGDVNVGSLSVDNSVAVGSSSNDPSASAAGEAGLGGSASATTTNTITNNPETNIVLGKGNRSFAASDNGRLNVSERNIQALEPSANGNINDDGKQNGQITADEQNGSPENSDDDGGNSLF